MVEAAETKVAASARPAATADKVAADQAERALLRATTLGLPAATILGAIGVGLASSAGPAILVLAGGVILGVIMLFWTSLRTLSGDAPLAPELVEAMAAQRARVTELAEKKRMALRALKDLDHEHEIGKIDDADYAELAATLRAQAKEIMRLMDDSLDAERVRAEEIARAHLKKKGLLTEAEGEPASATEAESEPDVSRRACPKCDKSNEPDAVFCKACGAAITTAKEAQNAPV